MTPYSTVFKSLTISLIALLPIQSIVVGAEEHQIPSKEKWTEITLEATVVGIDSKTREVTLRDDDGDMVTLEVSQYAGRFDEIKIGDKVSAAFLTYIKAEFRKPTAAELENPLTVLSQGEKASKSENPGLVMGSLIRAVVTVLNINLEEQLVTIMGPQGNYMVIPVKDTKVLNQRSVGELVILTYAEASSVTLEKMDP